MKIIRDLDRISFKEWFLNHGGSEKSLERMWDPIAICLGFINCKDISARCMLTIFMMFASKQKPQNLIFKRFPHKWLTQPIVDYITNKGAKIHLNHKVEEIIYEKESSSYSVNQLKISSPEGIKAVFADKFLAACDVPGIKK